MAGPFLDPLNPQSEHSEALLELVITGALTDRRYLERLEEHYGMVKTAATDPRHPAYKRIQQELSRAGDPEPPARNAPCPCGSGKKYKRCCMRKDRWRR
jgi:hypothetical protein